MPIPKHRSVVSTPAASPISKPTISLLNDLMTFISSYIVMPQRETLVTATWVMAAWLQELWDRFPHLAITSPEKRCGKTQLLELLFTIVPRPHYTTNISPPALYRVVEMDKPTLLIDESQSIVRRGSEASEVIREILNAGIGKNTKVTRCYGKKGDKIYRYSVYSPKVFAMIGELDSVLADRCLAVVMRRKTKDDVVSRFRLRDVESAGKDLHDKLLQWAGSSAKEVSVIYGVIEPFDIDNDRMADLLTPLQSVLTFLERPEGLERLEGNFQDIKPDSPIAILSQYASGIDEKEDEQEAQTPGIRLLAACRSIFNGMTGKVDSGKFIKTTNLIEELVKRVEEPWATYSKGEKITAEALAALLRQYEIRPAFNREKSNKGYAPYMFKDAWTRYLP